MLTLLLTISIAVPRPLPKPVEPIKPATCRVLNGKIECVHVGTFPSSPHIKVARTKQAVTR